MSSDCECDMAGFPGCSPGACPSPTRPTGVELHQLEASAAPGVSNIAYSTRIALEPDHASTHPPSTCPSPWSYESEHDEERRGPEVVDDRCPSAHALNVTGGGRARRRPALWCKIIYTPVRCTYENSIYCRYVVCKLP